MPTCNIEVKGAPRASAEVSATDAKALKMLRPKYELLVILSTFFMPASSPFATNFKEEKSQGTEGSERAAPTSDNVDKSRSD
ncbi:hypothetical protein EVAR_21689_1 [Eumeta japonica]|uniref:Uncharacterized protein n=1 Tax=Eumeta variegata TaxID=151549 RepID=A0A4C1W8Q4_EUMVA|nr:hypothetical protein EVAR_21689_1 [Eumeta japonica]